jgi:hypothetical protein
MHGGSQSNKRLPLHTDAPIEINHTKTNLTNKTKQLKNPHPMELKQSSPNRTITILTQWN